MKFYLLTATSFCAGLLLSSPAKVQIGKRFPSERKVVKDPVTGTMLTFLTSTPVGNAKGDLAFDGMVKTQL